VALSGLRYFFSSSLAPLMNLGALSVSNAALMKMPEDTMMIAAPTTFPISVHTQPSFFWCLAKEDSGLCRKQFLDKIKVTLSLD